MSFHPESRKRQARARIGGGFANLPVDILARAQRFADAARIRKVEDALICLLDCALTLAEKRGHMALLLRNLEGFSAPETAPAVTGKHG